MKINGKKQNIFYRWPKLKSFFSDSVWSILGLVTMNIVAQFIVYPIWSSREGAESYGNILYLLSFINIMAVSVGCGTNYSRMADTAKSNTTNGDYNIFLAVFAVLYVISGVVLSEFSSVQMSSIETVLYILLACVTTWRFYADVEFRMHVNYKQYFVYYICISFGYLAGICLYILTGIWMLALLPGEIAGLVYVSLVGSLLKNPFKPSEHFSLCVRSLIILFTTNLIANIILNGDRLLLKTLIGGTAVTIYYLSSLLGKTISLVSTPLNSVLVGYLSRYKGLLKRSLMVKILACFMLVIAVGTALCTLASHILISILYPSDYLLAKPFFIIANLAQVFYFVTNVITVILLRFAKQKYQLYINAVYGVSFVTLTVPATLLWGIWGFSFAALAANIARFAYAAALSLKYSDKGENVQNEEKLSNE